DKALETTARAILSTLVPQSVEIHMTYANPPSPWCPPPERITDAVIDRLNEGAWVVAYLGHGSPHSLDALEFEGRRHWLLTQGDAVEIESRRGAPLLFLIACSTGHMDGERDCLAEALLRRPKGPIAAIASSRVSMPYANGVLGREILLQLCERRPPTIGELVLHAKRALLDANEPLIEWLASTLYQPSGELRRQERAEHLYLYNLFGDPALRIPYPAEAAVECAASVAPGATLEVAGTSPVPGEALVELVQHRAAAVPSRASDDASERAFAETYERANRLDVARATAPVVDGKFRAKLGVPEGVEGAFFVRVFVGGEKGVAATSRPVTVAVAK
ncbi:MAG: C25 family cysteine peptidase, partial [Planctomycetota bacterium]